MKLKYLLLLGCLLLAVRFAGAVDTNSVSPAAAAANGFSGKVVDVINAAGYTYVQVDTGDKKLWAVTTEFPVKPGDIVTVGATMPMENYHSKSLNRDFALVYFASSIGVNGTGTGAVPALPPGHPPLNGTNAAGLPPGHPSLTSAGAAAKVELTGIKKAAGGKTIQEIYAAKAKVAGKTVAVRGKVVKYNAMIMGKNWLHIQDGSGSADDGNNDLTITTSTPAAVGDTVLVSGLVSTNRDFGAGYRYSIIFEDAKVTVE
jgi:hypothetical protein